MSLSYFGVDYAPSSQAQLPQALIDAHTNGVALTRQIKDERVKNSLWGQMDNIFIGLQNSNPNIADIYRGQAQLNDLINQAQAAVSAQNNVPTPYVSHGFQIEPTYLYAGAGVLGLLFLALLLRR